jgi:hypothetical protein
MGNWSHPHGLRFLMRRLHLPLFRILGLFLGVLVDLVDLAVGGFFSSPNYTSVRTFWFQTSLAGGEESVRAEPFEVIEMDMSRWWLDLEAP